MGTGRELRRVGNWDKPGGNLSVPKLPSSQLKTCRDSQQVPFLCFELPGRWQGEGCGVDGAGDGGLWLDGRPAEMSPSSPGGLQPPCHMGNDTVCVCSEPGVMCMPGAGKTSL